MSIADDAPKVALPPVDAGLLAEGVEMGFPEVRVRKALMAGSANAEAVVNWCLEHGEDAGVDDAIPMVAQAPGGGGGDEMQGEVQKSWKCVETGRLFRTMDEVQLYAEKTGRSNFAESTEEKKKLTPEEVAAKLEALKEKIALKRAESGEVVKHNPLPLTTPHLLATCGRPRHCARQTSDNPHFAQRCCVAPQNHPSSSLALACFLTMLGLFAPRYWLLAE